MPFQVHIKMNHSGRGLREPQLAGKQSVEESSLGIPKTNLASLTVVVVVVVAVLFW